MSFRGLVDLAKLRWRIERDYHETRAGAVTAAIGSTLCRPSVASSPEQ
jgi:hypothetical protein